MEDLRENVIEFLRDEKVATLSFTQKRYITRVRELAKKKPDECKIVHTNSDGSIVAHVPVAWIKINPCMDLSDEKREELSQRMRRVREQFK